MEASPWAYQIPSGKAKRMEVNMVAKVSVIVAHRNDPHLETTLRMLVEQDPGFEFEVVVVDDASDSEHAPNEELLEWNGVRLVKMERRGGCGAARNRGVRLTDSPVVAFFDSDLEPGEDWLREAYRHVGPGVMVTGPVPKRHRSKRPSLAERYNALESPHAAGARTYGTGNVVLMRDDFRRSGGFNPEMTRGHDMDFFSRWKGEVRVEDGMLASHPSKNHREKVQTIRELVRDWKKLGHRPSFVRRLAPDRTLLGNVMGADISSAEKAKMLGYHFTLKGYYLWYWLND